MLVPRLKSVNKSDSQMQW